MGELGLRFCPQHADEAGRGVTPCARPARAAAPGGRSRARILRRPFRGSATRTGVVAQVPVSADLLAAAAEVVDAWAPLAAHPNMGCPCGAFASGELGGGVALFLAHGFWPCAVTLEQAHLMPVAGPSGAMRAGPCHA